MSKAISVSTEPIITIFVCALTA